MRLTVSLFATWIAALVLGAAWSGYTVSFTAEAQVEDSHIIVG